METTEILTLQALKFKQKLLNDHQDLSSDAPEWMLDVDPGTDDTRNICALISIPLFDEINRVSTVLSMSKRRFVELALRDLAEKANHAIENVGLKNVTAFSCGEVPVDEA